MDVDTALSEVPVNYAPLIDDTDFKTREESVTYDQAGMDLVWNFVTTAGAFTQTAVTPTTGGTYDWTNQGNGMYTIEIPASGGASINNDTEGFGWFSGYATGVLPWVGPIIGFRAAGLNNKLVDDTYDTPRGLGGTALPAAAADAAGGLPISDAGGLDMDSKLANTNEVTAARMGALTDWINGGRLDLILDAIKAITDQINFTGTYVNAQVKAQDNIDFGALQKASLNAATPSVTVSDKTGFSLSVAGIQAIWDALTSALTTVGSIGKKLADWVLGTDNRVLLSANAQTGVTIPTVTNLTNERAKYMHGAVWIGLVGNTNTTSYVDGIMTNPVSTIAAAKTIADNLGLKRFWIQARVTVTLGADYDGYFFDGRDWMLTTSGSRSFAGSIAIGAVSVTGTFTSAGTPPLFKDCEFGATVSLPPCNVHHCEFGGTTTLNAAGNYDFIDCASVVAGTSTPVFAVPAGTVNISFRRWSGGIRITGITSGTTISIDMVSGGTVTLEGADGNVQIRGMAAGIVDNRTGTPTLGTDAVRNATKDLSNIGMASANMDTQLSTIDGVADAIKTKTDQLTFTTPNKVDATATLTGGDATEAHQLDMLDKLKGIMSKVYTLITGVGTFDPASHSLEAIRERGDAAWVTGGGLSGSNDITLTIQDDLSANVPDCYVEIWDSAGTAFYEKKITNSSGQTVHHLDNGTYKVKIHKGGYSFDDQTLVVTATASQTYTGERQIPAAPSSPSSCRVYEYAFMGDGITPMGSVTAWAKILSLPEDAGSMLVTGKEIEPIYDSSTGLLYWDIVQGASVEFNVSDFGINNFVKTVPATSTARLSALT